jgi:hypothetical protein
MTANQIGGGAPPLTPEESAALADHEAALDRHRRSFREAGEALRDIRDRRLYRETHPTFEAYCRERWGMSGTQAH